MFTLFYLYFWFSFVPYWYLAVFFSLKFSYFYSYLLFVLCPVILFCFVFVLFRFCFVSFFVLGSNSEFRLFFFQYSIPSPLFKCLTFFFLLFLKFLSLTLPLFHAFTLSVFFLYRVSEKGFIFWIFVSNFYAWVSAAMANERGRRSKNWKNENGCLLRERGVRE